MEVEGNRIFHLRVSGKKFTANSSGFLEIEIIFQPNFSICKQCSKPLHYSFYLWNYYWIRKFFWVSIVCNSHFGDNSLKHIIFRCILYTGREQLVFSPYEAVFLFHARLVLVELQEHYPIETKLTILWL